MNIPFSNTPLPNVQPGGVLEYDYRPFHKSGDTSSSRLKMLQWNIERNYEAEGIIEKIKDLDPDVCVLQEVDIGCRRSGNRNHMEELCRQLKMKGVFVCEFWELDDPIREDRDAGGGFHGNAILTKYDIADIRILNHQHESFHWERDGISLKEPRKGKRYTLAATIKRFALPPVLLYCVHLEVFTGIIGRVSAFSEILEDAQIHSNIPHQAIFGDLNTMAHSIARLSPKFARDRYRLLSLGESESTWFDRNILGHHVMDGPINTRLLTMERPLWQPLWFLKWMVTNNSNGFLQQWGRFLGYLLTGFSAVIMVKARNPGFYDGWPLDYDTLHNPAHFGLFKAKLDWTLLRNMAIHNRQVGNADYKLSDHQYLMVDVEMDDDDLALDANRSYATWLLRRNQIHDKKNTSNGGGASDLTGMLMDLIVILVLVYSCVYLFHLF
ncbi:hypothetical protein BCR42DRAFT_416129 [Absidia repens]|uniref:Endonuclease/exonuclease/phosphatase domain-containing protein n=1 Tax=Absidia repens TaxID=90262 RepID=A0A1X2IGF3_9FUNG|nr:hypothetical protein BCR42DRAFT_416129 [Absidia repens]